MRRTRKKSGLHKATDIVAKIIQEQLDTLPPAVAEAKRKQLHRLAVRVSPSSTRGADAPGPASESSAPMRYCTPAIHVYLDDRGRCECGALIKPSVPMNPADCNCRHVHCSSATCRSTARSQGAVKESERIFPVPVQAGGLTHEDILRRWINDANQGRIKDGKRELSNNELAIVSTVLRRVAAEFLMLPSASAVQAEPQDERIKWLVGWFQKLDVNLLDLAADMKDGIQKLNELAAPTTPAPDTKLREACEKSIEYLNQITFDQMNGTEKVVYVTLRTALAASTEEGRS